MNDVKFIDIFAQSDTTYRYLADIVVLAGGRPRAKADRAIAAIMTIDDKSIKTPIKAADLVQKIRQQLMAGAQGPESLTIGGCTLDTRHGFWILASGESIRLTEKEVAILSFLKNAAPSIVSKQDLLEKVWSYAEGVETHTLETHIYRLRQKIEADPSNPQILLTQEDGYSIKP